MTDSATALDRLWHRNGGRARTAGQMQDDAWMLVHEASPALYLDLLGALHGRPDAAPKGAQPCRDGRFRRLLESLGRRHPVDTRPVPLRPEADHA